MRFPPTYRLVVVGAVGEDLWDGLPEQVVLDLAAGAAMGGVGVAVGGSGEADEVGGGVTVDGTGQPHHQRRREHLGQRAGGIGTDGVEDRLPACLLAVCEG